MNEGNLQRSTDEIKGWKLLTFQYTVDFSVTTVIVWTSANGSVAPCITFSIYSTCPYGTYTDTLFPLTPVVIWAVIISVRGRSIQ